MISHRSIVSVVSSLAVAFLGGSIWLTNLKQPMVFAEGRQTNRPETPREKNRPIAVVELFTSEGCSSCPPADENLQRITRVAAKLNHNVFPLSFHVDYWNRLGWKDPFSQAAFSARQREYAAVLQSDTYTPQMIVNGTTEFVGSDRRLTDRAIETALESPAKLAVTLSILEVKDRRRMSLRYEVTGSLSKTDNVVDDVLNIAVATDSETVSVARGENSGKTLSHAWVVKDFQVIPLTSLEGSFEIDLASVKQKHSRLIAYIQSRSTRAITGATALDL